MKKKPTFYKKFKLSDLDHLEMSTNDFDHEKFQTLNYSNLGYDLLSRVIELIEKKQFSHIIEEISVEAGLASTSLIQINDSLHLS